MKVAMRDSGTSVLEMPSGFEMNDEVASFVAQHPYLSGLLEQATTKVTEIFGESAMTRVELHHDPEEGYEELFVVVSASLEPEEAMDCLRRLDEEWLLNVLSETQGKFNVIVALA
jgi:hypothetical protein